VHLGLEAKQPWPMQRRHLSKQSPWQLQHRPHRHLLCCLQSACAWCRAPSKVIGCCHAHRPSHFSDAFRFRCEAPCSNAMVDERTGSSADAARRPSRVMHFLAQCHCPQVEGSSQHRRCRAGPAGDTISHHRKIITAKHALGLGMAMCFLAACQW
jgi:hypothetical protein